MRRPGDDPAFHAIWEVTRSRRCQRSGVPVAWAQCSKHVFTTMRRHGRPPVRRRIHVREHIRREQRIAMFGQKREHTPRGPLISGLCAKEGPFAGAGPSLGRQCCHDRYWTCEVSRASLSGRTRKSDQYRRRVSLVPKALQSTISLLDSTKSFEALTTIDSQAWKIEPGRLSPHDSLIFEWIQPHRRLQSTGNIQLTYVVSDDFAKARKQGILVKGSRLHSVPGQHVSSASRVSGVIIDHQKQVALGPDF